MIISVVNVKGGVGKTTISSNLAAIFAYANPKSKVMLVDTDPQKSAFQFGEFRNAQRETNPNLPKISVTALTDKTLEQITDFGHDFYIIDCGGSNNITLRKSIALSDLCIIPLQASAFDVLSTRTTITFIEEIKISKPDLKVRFLLNRLKYGVKANQDIEGVFREINIPFFKTRIFDRVAYQYSVPEGRSVMEFDDEFSKEEVSALYREIIEIF